LKKKRTSDSKNKKDIDTLILGIGNVLMGDEGVGVHVARWLLQQPLPSGVVCVDGGTGGFHLLEMLQQAKKIILIDATLDNHPPGTLQRLQPRFSSQYPKTLTAHDIGLKDLIDAFHLLAKPGGPELPEVTLFAVSISFPAPMGLELSPPIASLVPKVADRVLAELATSGN
jgi:hydrogenase maturation protease